MRYFQLLYCAQDKPDCVDKLHGGGDDGAKSIQRSRMGQLTTHVLDTAHGCPAGGMAVALFRCHSGGRDLVQKAQTNADGRCDRPLLEGAECMVGEYELVFQVGTYFKGLSLSLPDPPFLDEVVLRFGIADREQRYHVPLLVSPWGYSTYRGS